MKKQYQNTTQKSDKLYEQHQTIYWLFSILSVKIK